MPDPGTPPEPAPELPPAYVAGGRRTWSLGGWRALELAALGLLVAVVVLPLGGLYRHTGAAMEEGFMLVFPTLVQQGEVPNVDFLHLYGPASLDVLALWFRIFGDSLGSERTFGLLQHLGIITAIYALARVAGRMAACAAATVAALFILTPIGLSALAWHGGLALGLWATVVALRATATQHVGAWWVAGGLAGLALGYRPDLVVALGLALGWLLWRRSRVGPIGWWTFAAGVLVGLLPMWWHLARAGLGPAFDGMVLDPVVELRPARELPRPPSWGEIDGALQAVAEGPPPRWWLPAPAASQQLFLWFWLVVVGAVGAVVWAARVRRRDDIGAGGDVLLAGSLFGLGIISQALQRPDSTHLAWVSVVSWPMLVALGALTIRRIDLFARRPDGGLRSGLAAGIAAAIVLVAVCPFWTYRMWALQTRVALGDLPPPFVIERDDHRFWVGDPVVAAAVNEMIPDLDAITDPGDVLIVGTGDLSRTVYVDTYIYWLFPELEPGTRFIEMEPGITDVAGSGLAEEIAAADVVVLTNTWSGWVEPNASVEYGSDEHNRAVADHHCLVESYESNLVLLFERCEGGGGFDPSTVAGRSPDGGGVPGGHDAATTGGEGARSAPSG